MTKEEMIEMSEAPYANARRKFLENNAPDVLQAMGRNGTLIEHLASVEEFVEKYIDERCEAVKKTDRYLNADFYQQIKIVRSEHVFARQDAFLMWVCALP